MHKSVSFFVIAILFALIFKSCRLFDKEIRQDEHIAAFRHQLNRVQDSLGSQNKRVKAYKELLVQINEDNNLITPRKKNNLLIEGNLFLYDEYLRSKNYRKAIFYSDVVLEIDSTSASGYYSRGCVYQIMGQDAQALGDYNNALRFDMNNADAYYNRGIIYEKNEKYDLALSDYDRSINLKPPYLADVYNNRGNVYMQKEIIDKAIEDYDRAVALDSLNVKAYSNRAWAYVKQEDFDKAMIDCDIISSIEPNNITAHLRRAIVYESKNDYKKAIREYKRVLELDPEDEHYSNDVAKEAIERLKAGSKKR